jgi:DNA-binding transcriptional LysR family regulator
MDLLQLKYFCHAASTLNFSKTAQTFFVPPSNISQCIKRLESELNVPLFIRSANRIQLSPQGEMFYQGVQKSLELLDSTTEAVITSVREECVRIGLCLHRQTVMRIIEQYKSKYPGVQVLYERPQDPANGFSFDGYDLVMAGQAVENPEYERTLLAHNKILLFAPKGLLKADSITPEVLQQQVFISHPPGSYMYRNTQLLCQSLGIKPRFLTQEKHSIYFIPRCIEERRGIAFVPRPTVWAVHMAEYLDSFDVGEYYQDAFMYSKKETLSPYVISLIALIKDEYKKNQLSLANDGRTIQTVFTTPLTQQESL